MLSIYGIICDICESKIMKSEIVRVRGETNEKTPEK